MKYNEIMNKELLKKWILFAKSDLDATQRLFESPRPNSWTYLLILWHCHQAIEKILKMVIVKKNKELFRINDLPRLLKYSEIKNISEEHLDFIFNLNSFYLRPRYPDMNYDPFPKLNRKSTEKYLRLTKELFLWIKKQK